MRIRTRSREYKAGFLAGVQQQQARQADAQQREAAATVGAKKAVQGIREEMQRFRAKLAGTRQLARALHDILDSMQVD